MLGRIINALVAIDADMADIPDEIRGRLTPDVAMSVYWFANSITPGAAAELFEKAGIIPSPTDEKLQELNNKWEQEWSALGIVATLLNKRLAWFDMETSRVTPDYLQLLSILLVVSSPIFQVEALSQTVDEETGQSEVHFVYNGREHTFTVRNYGDFYDAPLVLAGLNRALAEGDREERFLPLHTGDQTASVVFVPEEAFLRVAQILHIPLEGDPDES